MADAVFKQMGSVIATEIGKKQEKLVSGTNIKTVFGEEVIGSGDIVIPAATSTTLGGVKLTLAGTTLTINV